MLFVLFIFIGTGRLELPRAQCPTDFKSGASTDSATLPNCSAGCGDRTHLRRIMSSLLSTRELNQHDRNTGS